VTGAAAASRAGPPEDGSTSSRRSVSTSGCVRATAVDAYSHGYHVVLVEECCFDRSILSHQINLFDMHHKYVDVMHVNDVVAHLDGMAIRKAS
jgi:isochorismate hydrolase